MEKKENLAAQIVTTTLYLKSREYITPHYIRIRLTGDDVYKFAEPTIGVNNKIYIPPVGVDEVHYPSWDFEAEKWNMPPIEVRPAIRTYTHRGIDLEKKEMIIDFVAHGDQGPASAWAIHAKPGAPLGISMRAKSTELYPKADWYLLAGDATAIPVMAAILEDLPEGAEGFAYLEVASEAEEQLLQTKSKVQIKWIHNPVAGEGTFLAEAVRQTSLPEGETPGKFAYVAAEFKSVKAIRQYLRNEAFWPREEVYAYSYWKAGISEDGSEVDRRAEYLEK
ncbi:siderophore-interacting protein [Pedobacter caeni]|uniref:NADPH-dependent ferric siderophore reductase, contains FAD-binding and SIP domains n=1 Tax=Pedobacter caeni TaxID=288992 RepID=A0A1M5K386_9SPHI|nr:siderophore-interacting protein [Pedobacter caeni]SHG47211.1 NADPH-dependent ferric siderophore reductase, contains FAD-binding and SIP domains [Pedobacter caeni]